MAEFTDKQRKELVKKGLAMPDGGYPIRSRRDLQNAIAAYGRGKNKPEIKKWIKKRAKELDALYLLPKNWKVEDNDEDSLSHYGVKGMKWGVRRKRQLADRRNYRSMTRSERKANQDKRNSRYSNSSRDIDKQLYGSGGVKRINRRMNKGQSYARASLAEGARRAAIVSGVALGVVLASNPGIVKSGASSVNNILKNKAQGAINSAKAKNAARQAQAFIPRLVENKKRQYKVY